jgi:hypothetical protein
MMKAGVPGPVVRESLLRQTVTGEREAGVVAERSQQKLCLFVTH